MYDDNLYNFTEFMTCTKLKILKPITVQTTLLMLLNQIHKIISPLKKYTYHIWESQYPILVEQ